MSLTREQILTLPADQLAEVSARMMGRAVVNKVFTSDMYIPGSTRTGNPQCVYFTPHTDHNDARCVADWVGEEWATITPKQRPECKPSDPRDAIDFALSEVMGTENNHWAWTPEQLTRAALLAFVDNGGEI